MKIRKVLNIGDVFLTWIVTEYSNPKKYKYKCKCSECGNEREFIKYNLLKGKYAPCKQCGHKKVRNIHLIRKHWNCELNGVIFDTPDNFNLTQSFWFVCNQGHNFKSSIKDFSLQRCLGCNEVPSTNPSRIQAKEYCLQYFSSVSKAYELHPYVVYVEEFKTMLYISEEDRYNSYRKYFNSEGAMLKEIDNINLIKLEAHDRGIIFIQVDIKNNLKFNVDTFEKTMLRLVHSH